jgi:hypothetical protein
VRLRPSPDASREASPSHLVQAALMRKGPRVDSQPVVHALAVEPAVGQHARPPESQGQASYATDRWGDGRGQARMMGDDGGRAARFGSYRKPHRCFRIYRPSSMLS